MKLAQQLLEAGIFHGEPLEGELRAAVEQIMDLTPKGDWREGKELTIAVLGSNFYVYDFDGYLCNTRSVEALVILLMMSDREFKLSPREVLFGTKPMTAVATVNVNRDFEQLRARAREMTERMQEKLAHGPKGSPGFGDESGITEDDGPVRTVGIADGNPIFPRD